MVVLAIVTSKRAGPALVGAGPDARLGHGAPMSSGGMTSSCSVNRATTFLTKMF